jgi:type IV pilus assembly protein PilB
MKSLQEAYTKIIAAQNTGAKSNIFGKPGTPAEATNLTSQVTDFILSEALTARSSDIHFEPLTNHLRIRFRIDGKLYDALEIKNSANITIVARIKILSNLPTDAMSSQKPMDGRFSYKNKTQEFDCRVSTFPTLLGEKIVIRILNKDATLINLKKVGFHPSDLAKIEQCVQRRSGLFIVSGPTGSGKTTTLYSILNHLHTPHVNIVTLEDPVEYQIEGMNQCDIKKRGDGNFASGLKAILRQDPDVILIGEIRDSETAEIAIRASITGHFVITSLHANSAIGTAIRLINMGLERYMVSYAVVGAIAQRLVRRLCPKCKIPYPIKAETLNRIYQRYGLSPDVVNEVELNPSAVTGEIQLQPSGNASEITLYKGSGCDACSGTGYMGRLAVFEVVNFNERLRDAIISNVPPSELETIAKEKGGFRSLALDALQKVRAGVITFDDIYPILLEKT